jgi:hypothetical protein
MSEPWVNLASAAVGVFMALGCVLVALASVLFVAWIIWDWIERRHQWWW